MRVLFFSPHAGIWVHSFPEALLADAVRAAGAELVYVTCDGAFSSICIPMAARGLSVESPSGEKEQTCRDCRRNRDRLRRGFALPGYDFDSSLSAADRDRITALLDGLKAKDASSFAVDGVEVGRAALYEYLIQKKKTDVEISDSEWSAFRPRLANVLQSLFAAKQILERENPDRVVVYNSLYSVNAVWRALADQRNIPVYFVHAGLNLKNRLQTLFIGRDSTLMCMRRLVAAWPEYAELPCNETELAAVTDHFAELFKGTSVFAYSAPASSERQSVRDRFGVRADQKVLVASMSSYDEYAAARAIGEMPAEAGLVFATQIDWIRALSTWFSTRPDLFLLIRVHPREFPNKREGLKSEHARMLERELSQLPANVRVNWPSDRLSIYDIAEHADVFLNAWSSAGKEMALLGLPVVVYCPELLLYPANLNYVGTTRDSYFAAIESALRDGWSFERVRAAYRWCVLEYVRAIADISDGFDYSETRAATMWQRARGLLFMVPGVREQRDLLRRPRTLREQGRLGRLILSGKPSLLDVPPDQREAASEANESAALRRQVRRLAAQLYRGRLDAVEPGTLRQRLSAITE
ncbi:MAG: hypothetical protein JWM53_5067 [bacterium]|nr:hypothetical protein [bacterium]